MNTHTTVMVVDDHSFIRNAISDMLNKKGNYLVYTAKNGFEALASADEYELDLIIMDIVMPEKDGIETTREITKKYPHVKTLILTGAYTHECVFKILEAGALGCILKDAPEIEMNIAIEKVLKGEYYFGSKPMNDIVLDVKDIVLPRKVVPDEAFLSLTEREKEIVEYISKGLVNKEIAAKLFVSKRTVDKHRTNILQKINVHNSAELIAYAVKHGIIN